MKSKSTAGILALFIGGFGIHKFYLGKTSMGILYALFFWTFIPAIVAFFEGIILLTMSEDAFNQKYNLTYYLANNYKKESYEKESIKKVVIPKVKSDIVETKKDVHRDIKRTIFDFFSLDITKVPDSSFIKAEQSNNAEGKQIQTYRKILTYKECDIFDTVEVKVVDSGSTNISFESFSPETVDIDALKILIEDLYLIYGSDESEKGRFTDKDIEAYFDSDFYALFGRMWLESSKYKYPILLSRDEQVISLTIWGANEQGTDEQPIIKFRDTSFNQEAKLARRNWQKLNCTGTFILQESTFKGHLEALTYLKTFDSYREYLRDNQNYYSVDFNFDEETPFRDLMNSTTKVRKFTEIKIGEKNFNPKEFNLAIWLNTSKNNSEFEERLATAKESNTPEIIMKALEIISFLKLLTSTKG